MALISFCGVPGSGKTLNATRAALKHYKKENSRIKYFISFVFSKFHLKISKIDYDYYSNFPYRKINNIYSNYPILLDKKRKIFSNRINLWDLNNNYSFLPNAFIIIDEIQLYADSDEYKDQTINFKLSKVARFLQAHRHYGVKTIIIISQNPSRIFKKARNICESYLKLNKVLNLPFNLSIVKGRGYYDLDYYGKYVPTDRKERKKLPFDYYRYINFFNRKKVFNAYDSRYLSNYNYNKPLYQHGYYENLKIEYEFLEELFER